MVVSTQTPDPAHQILSVAGLKKYFGGVKALDGVDFSLERGEVHALVGENGAGKSTLIKVLTGVYGFDVGDIQLNGNDYKPTAPIDAKKHGVQVVHQEFNLLSHLSVAENIAIESFPRTRFGLLDRSEMERRARLALDAIGLSDVSVRTTVDSLGVAHRQLVEIARALQSDSEILILDEPTATLTERETERLFKIIADIKRDGVTVVFVTHHLNEVFEICDRVTIFRNGETVVSENIAETTPENVVRHMVGRSLSDTIDLHDARPEKGETALSLNAFRVAECPHEEGVSLDLRYGEIVGIAGLVGSGRTEILRGVFGINEVLSGSIQRDGQDITIKGPADAIKAGIGFVTEDRKDEGLILSMSISANVAFPNMEKISHGGILNGSKENDLAVEGGERLQLKYGKITDAASSLSGGNQQKVVLAKWLATQPTVLLLDEPTRGVDVGAKAEIYTILRGLAESGVAILVVSSEMPELMRLCDRILVLSNHQIQGCVQRADFSEERILQLAYQQESAPREENENE
ncbi:sugar ABC transporter ATP-binding protein [Cohaesibacter celericrescens]|uniref:D-xylose ABC transporter ATP-binding protein n=1 Tax=Cohaesibacter celericrescens TaxID=2067669 RepID=A0A2N5XU14_9HYPH|nr:sugar ABC transporter ATP-binding protein [Cohaesibacter celericrescens]PLW77947.1 D-xylose ABC transporter ATP-binding protein [Cohaesibacter celericrescens]